MARLLASVVSIWAAPSGAQEVLFDDGVAWPFSRPEAIAALKEDLLQNGGPDALAGLPPNSDEALPRISWWGYRIDRGADGTVTARFVQRLSAKAVMEGIRSWLGRMKKSGCSFVHPGTPQLQVNRQSVDYQVSFSGKKRACTDTPFGEINTDLASIGGRANGTISFRVIPSDAVARYHGKVELSEPTLNVDIEANEILGINVDSVVGSLLTNFLEGAGSPFGAAMMPSVGVPSWAMVSAIDDGMREARGRVSDAAVYLKRMKGDVNPEDYNKSLASSQTVAWSYQPNWTMSENETRFTGSGDDIELEIVFTAPVPDFGQVEQSVDGAGATLRQLRSYSDVTKTILAKKGDNWSLLAEAAYGSQFMASALRESQAERSRRPIQAGQSVEVPPLWKVSILEGRYVVRPGDTFVGLCTRREKTMIAPCVQRLGKLNPGIQPRRLPALSVIRWGPFPAEPNTDQPLMPPLPPPPKAD